MSPPGRVVTPENSNHFYFGRTFLSCGYGERRILRDSCSLLPFEFEVCRAELLEQCWMAGASADSASHRPIRLEA
jgi:hypothetical protein